MLSTNSIKKSVQMRKSRTNIIKRTLELRCKTTTGAQVIVLEHEFQNHCFMEVHIFTFHYSKDPAKMKG